MEDVDEQELHVEQVAVLDLGKAVLEGARGCHRSPSRAGVCRRCAALPPPPRRCWRWLTERSRGNHRIVGEPNTDICAWIATWISDLSPVS
jgi:hypothetical protein